MDLFREPSELTGPNIDSRLGPLHYLSDSNFHRSRREQHTLQFIGSNKTFWGRLSGAPSLWYCGCDTKSCYQQECRG